MKNFIEFQWKVTKGGYQIIKTTNSSLPCHAAQRYLTDGLIGGETYDYKLINPFNQDAALFVEFSRLDCSRNEDLLSFANQYGQLGESISILLPDRQTSSGTPSGFGEPLGLWKEEATAMQRAVAIWEMLRVDDRKGLSRLIRWKKGGRVAYEDGVPFETEFTAKTIEQPYMTPTGPRYFQTGDVIQPAWFWLQRTINDCLIESPFEQKNPGKVTFPRVAPKLLWDQSPDILRLCMVPYSLIGALWLQFALAVQEGTEYRQCNFCGKPFMVGPEAKHSNAQFCTESHRKLAWQREQRQQKKQAMQKAM